MENDMATKPVKDYTQSGWGGPREGAGRPIKPDAKRNTITIRVDDETMALLKAAGQPTTIIQRILDDWRLKRELEKRVAKAAGVSVEQLDAVLNTQEPDEDDGEV